MGRHIPVILPLHPRTKKMAKVYRLFSTFKNIRFIEPAPYLDMLNLEKNAKAILTDSGGVQKEAYWLRVPCFTLRDETEWIETVNSGWNVLVGAKTERIMEEVSRFSGKNLPKRSTLFGDGKASRKIVEILMKYSS
jgi:UDP-N-acetylglucosamine 2-epimerase